MNKIKIVNGKYAYDLIFLFDEAGKSYELSVNLSYKDFKKALKQFSLPEYFDSVCPLFNRDSILKMYFILREHNLGINPEYRGSLAKIGGNIDEEEI